MQILLSDNKCQELWVLLQQTRKVDALSNQNMIRYRREAERHVGTDEHLYRFDWVCERLNFGIICDPDMK